MSDAQAPTYLPVIIPTISQAAWLVEDHFPGLIAGRDFTLMQPINDDGSPAGHAVPQTWPKADGSPPCPDGALVSALWTDDARDRYAALDLAALGALRLAAVS